MDLLFLSKRIFLGTEQGFLNGGIIVDTEGIIRKILRTAQEVNTYVYNTESEAVYDFGDKVLMPGLIDANVNVSEPGRKDWEGFVTATKAAAAGGFTTIIDRPTNTIPPTTSVAALKTKSGVARGKIYVDVGFWGGLVPENAKEAEPLLGAGVIGLQCTLSPTPAPVGDAFPAINRKELEEVIEKLEDGTVVAFNAELPLKTHIAPDEEEPKKYESFSRTRPAEMEVNAVQLISQLATAYKGKHMHIMNVSSADVLPIVAQCKRAGANLTVETCPHYLTLCAEQIEDCHTEFKAQPPIRSKSNQPALWDALKNGCVDIIASNHSPATPGVKCLNYGRARGNFLNAWPGVSSLQLGLSVVWTHCQTQGLGMEHIYRLMCQNPAVLCGLSSFKSKIEEGYDADFCIWDPEEEFSVSADMLFSTNKATPYMDQRLRGVVHATVVRGLHVYQQYEGFGQPLGKVLLRKTTKKIVKFVRM
ncbi:allantoinase [Zeugodacus cucurbitae]|uniref:allantoinase n=1 Tax=Zeugodacus cucurbitae TaxID=28588 RepID=A0A0A1WU62_ZEUCU|nr:allantoinase [Zeugodacus cucurbitae]